MSEQRFAWVDHKIWALEQRVAKAEYQLRLLAGAKQAHEPEPEPESRRTAPAPQSEPLRTAPVSRPAQPAYVPPLPQARSAPKHERDTEYLIGAKLLPKVGAGMVVLAILFFVLWGFTSGWITPLMVFCGEIAFSLAFIVLGLVKRNEREEFGQILTAIGSCGLYLTLAGGHVFYSLYSAEALVAQFMGLSLASLGYSLWRSSRSFLAIGLVGGLIAALLPTREHNFVLNTTLHFAILIPAAYVAAKNRWSLAGLSMWAVSTAALTPLLLSPLPWSGKVAALYGGALACLVVMSRERKSAQPGIAIGMAASASAALSMALMHQPQGAIHLSLWGIALFGLSRWASDAKAGQMLAALGIGIPLVLAPMCFPMPQCAAIFAGIALLCSGLPFRRAAWFGVAELGLGLCAYLVAATSNPMEKQAELMLIGGLTVAALALTRALISLEGKTEVFVMSCIGLLVPLWARFAHVEFRDMPSLITAELATTLGLAALSWFMTALAWKTRWVSARVAQWWTYAAALVAYLYMCSEVRTDLPAEASVLLTLMAGCIAAACATFHVNGRSHQQCLAATAILIVGVLFMRLFWICVAGMPAPLDPALILCLSLIALTLGTAALTVRTGWAAANTIQYAWLGTALAMYYFSGHSDPSHLWDLSTACALLVTSAITACVGWNQAREQEKDTIALLFTFLAGVLGLRIFGLATQTAVWPLSITIAATAYAGLVAMLHMWHGRRRLLAPAWLFLVYASYNYMLAVSRADLTPGQDFGLLTGILATFSLLSARSQSAEDRETYWVTISLVGWALVSRWFGIGLQALGMNVAWSGAMTMAWTLYAFALLFIGLGSRIKELRYVSFAVLAATSGKVLLVDLASAEPAVRVVALLGLGLTMLGGGYWYVRGRTRLEG